MRDDVILAMAKDIVYTHHEKWDGTGYPQGLRGTSIPIAGRLMALVDVYDAVTSRRALSRADDRTRRRSPSSSPAGARTSIRRSSTRSSKSRGMSNGFHGRRRRS